MKTITLKKIDLYIGLSKTPWLVSTSIQLKGLISLQVISTRLKGFGTLYFSWSQIYVHFFWNNLVNPRFSLAHNTSLPFMVPLSCSAITKFRLFLQTTNLFTFRGPTLPHLSHIIIKTNSWTALKREIFTDITDNEHPQGGCCQCY